MTDASRELFLQGEAAKALLANIRDVIGDDDEMAMTAVEGETGLIEAISGAVDRIAELNGFCEALESKIKALGERRDRFSSQADRIKAAIHVAMGHANMRALELPQATLSVRAVAPSVTITDEAAIPPKFWKEQAPKLDKRAILSALKADEAIPGATLLNGSETLAIRDR